MFGTLKAHIRLVPAQRGVLVRAREVERKDLILVANEDHVVVPVDVGVIGGGKRIRELLSTGDRRSEHLCTGAPDRKAQSNCAERERGDASQELPSVRDKRTVFAVGFVVAIYGIRGLHICQSELL